MTILAIDTSCDDTCIAIVEAKNSSFKILSNIISSQIKVHKKWGGVVPTLAKREHQKNLPIILKEALIKTKNPKGDEFHSSSPFADARVIDLIAVTVGPGLEPCLWVGVNFAKKLAQDLKLPIVPVNHIEAHVLANWLNKKPKTSFPAICLVVSGGHTQLILMRDIGEYKILGETRDDAAGECLDKVARILGLSYPGGPIISKLATRYKIQEIRYEIQLPRPMIHQKNYDFSFSGLKTAVLYNFKSQSPKTRKSILQHNSGLTLSEIEASKKYIQEMCFETQQAMIDVLVKKTIKAAKGFRVKTIILGGGVAANEELRKQFKEKIQKEIPNAKYLIPDPKYCTDNGVMIGVAAYFHRKEATEKLNKIKAEANLRI